MITIFIQYMHIIYCKGFHCFMFDTAGACTSITAESFMHAPHIHMAVVCIKIYFFVIGRLLLHIIISYSTNSHKYIAVSFIKN